jgi:hypothetical protein
VYRTERARLVAAGTAADAGTKKRLIASYLGAEEEICCRSQSSISASSSAAIKRAFKSYAMLPTNYLPRVAPSFSS